MSVFEDGKTNPPATEDYVAKIKELKGENWQDPNVIAKGYLAAQDHITSVERTLEELREDLSKRTTAEEILKELKEAQAKPTAGDPPPTNSGGETENTTQVSSEDIKSLIDEALTVREQSQSRKQNIEEADRKITERFGTDASKVVEAKAQELGLSKERLAEIAGESPSAFLNLMGEAPQTTSNQNQTSQVNTQSDSFTSSSNERSWEFYSKMRRENPKLYYSPRMQRQLEDDYAAGKVRIPT